MGPVIKSGICPPRLVCWDCFYPLAGLILNLEVNNPDGQPVLGETRSSLAVSLKNFPFYFSTKRGVSQNQTKFSPLQKLHIKTHVRFCEKITSVLGKTKTTSGFKVQVVGTSFRPRASIRWAMIQYRPMDADPKWLCWVFATKEMKKEKQKENLLHLSLRFGHCSTPVKSQWDHHMCILTKVVKSKIKTKTSHCLLQRK